MVTTNSQDSRLLQRRGRERSVLDRVGTMRLGGQCTTTLTGSSSHPTTLLPSFSSLGTPQTPSSPVSPPSSAAFPSELERSSAHAAPGPSSIQQPEHTPTHTHAVIHYVQPYSHSLIHSYSHTVIIQSYCLTLMHPY